MQGFSRGPATYQVPENVQLYGGTYQGFPPLYQVSGNAQPYSWDQATYPGRGRGGSWLLKVTLNCTATTNMVMPWLITLVRIIFFCVQVSYCL